MYPNVFMKVLFGVLSGAMNMGLTTPHLEAFALARGSAAAIFAVLDRVPEIDSLSKTGEKPTQLIGDIQLQGVHFEYPARPEVKVGVIFTSHKLQKTKTFITFLAIHIYIYGLIFEFAACLSLCTLCSFTMRAFLCILCC
jgi:ABC-type multidrug transport system fused ATPase/permease subunit